MLRVVGAFSPKAMRQLNRSRYGSLIRACPGRLRQLADSFIPGDWGNGERYQLGRGNTNSAQMQPRERPPASPPNGGQAT
jgi:hypothetical protein